MTIVREDIYAALFTRVSTAAGFNTKGRRFKPWTEVPPTEQPVIFQVQWTEESQTETGKPTIWKFHVDLVIYANSGGDNTTVVSTIINPILDAVTNLFNPSPSTMGKQTLGGLVHYARVSGPIETDEGVLGAQAYAIIPIEILVS